MGFKFDEKTLINNNIFKYEDKLNSQVTRFLDKRPTYVTYYNVNVNESTVDIGFSNVEKVVGSNSPIRYSEVKNFPVYGMEAIQLQLDDEIEGLNTSYDGELIILPDTVKPYPNDFFIIDHKGKDFLFMVTGVNYDTIKSNNFYKISFTVKYVEPEDTEKIFKQVNKQYTCIVDNIGTQDKCIIEDDILELINRFLDSYMQLSERYLLYFYHKKYNTITYTDKNKLTIYDRYLNKFIQSNGLLYDKDTHKCIYLCENDVTCDSNLEYDRSIYKLLELRKPRKIKPFKFTLVEIKDLYSVFTYYNVLAASVRFKNGNLDYIQPYLLNAMKNGEFPNVENIKPSYMIMHEIDPEPLDYLEVSELDNIIVKYLHEKIDSIYDIDFNQLEDDIYFDINWENYIKIPMVLFAMKKYYKIFMRKQLVN